MSTLKDISKQIRDLHIKFELDLKKCFQEESNLINFKKVNFLKENISKEFHYPLFSKIENIFQINRGIILKNEKTEEKKINLKLDSLYGRFLKDLDRLALGMEKVNLNYKDISFIEFREIMEMEDYIFREIFRFNEKVSLESFFYRDKNLKENKDIMADNFIILNISIENSKKLLSYYKTLESSSFINKEFSFNTARYIDYFIDEISEGYYLKNLKKNERLNFEDKGFMVDYFFDLMYLNKDNLSEEEIKEDIHETLLRINSYEQHVNKMKFINVMKGKK